MRLPLALLLPFAVSSALAADSDVALTVYSSAQPGQIDSQRLAQYGDQLPGYALIRDQRRLSIRKGRSELRFSDVAARMDPTTVTFESLTDPDGTRVLEQNYQFDLVSSEKLLQRFINQRITLDQPRGEKTESYSGRLLSAEGGVILELDSGEIVSLQNWGNIRYPSLPGGLITEPSLVWLLNAVRGGEHMVQVAYQAKGLTWWADYNAVLDESDGCRLDLGSWVTIVNQSGGSFPNAKLKLVAGDVNRAPSPTPQPSIRAQRMMSDSIAEAEGFQESSLFEYHLYTLGRRSDLPNNSTKQLELFPAAPNVACEKQLVFTAAPQHQAYWGEPNTDQGYAATSPGTVGAFLQFDNKKAQGLGIALPAGRVRVNQSSGDDGDLEFIGEDVIKHTPRNESISIKLGNAFDIVGERKQTSFKVDSNAKWMEESFEISVRNRKEVAATVLVREYLYRWSNAKISNASHKTIERDARTTDFVVDLPADGEAKVRYTVRYTW